MCIGSEGRQWHCGGDATGPRGHTPAAGPSLECGGGRARGATTAAPAPLKLDGLESDGIGALCRRLEEHGRLAIVGEPVRVRRVGAQHARRGALGNALEAWRDSAIRGGGGKRVRVVSRTLPGKHDSIVHSHETGRAQGSVVSASSAGSHAPCSDSAALAVSETIFPHTAKKNTQKKRFGRGLSPPVRNRRRRAASRR